MQGNDQETRTWAMLCHLASLAWVLLMFIGIPPFLFINIVGPLIVWLAKKSESELIDAHGRESINFQISMTLYGIGLSIIFGVVVLLLISAGVIAAVDGSPLALILGGIGIIWLVIIAAIIGLLELVLTIYAAVKANKGEFYRYPFTIRFL